MKIINLHIVSNKTYINLHNHAHNGYKKIGFKPFQTCLLYTSDAADEL